MARSKNCMDCGEYFPSRLMVDGKSHILTSCKRCLRCQPFKERLGVRPIKVKPLAKTMSNYASWPEDWKEEHRLRVLEKGAERKKALVALGGGVCRLCGYSRCLRAMSFHHRVREEKSFALVYQCRLPWTLPAFAAVRGLFWSPSSRNALCSVFGVTRKSKMNTENNRCHPLHFGECGGILPTT